MTKQGVLVLALVAASLSNAAWAGDVRSQAIEMIKRDFQPKGTAGVDRVNQDGVQTVCNRTADNPPKALAAMLEKDQADGIRWPADGKLMGDWKSGEAIAQSGRGMTWIDGPTVPAGGNCYNCHQLTKEELSYGTLGPSLYNFGKIRGSTEEMQKYVYGRIYNAKAYNLCSNMPRFGHAGALTEKQIKDLVALLLDPASPVNK